MKTGIEFVIRIGYKSRPSNCAFENSAAQFSKNNGALVVH
jgi:hypothetical protein